MPNKHACSKKKDFALGRRCGISQTLGNPGPRILHCVADSFFSAALFSFFSFLVQFFIVVRKRQRTNAPIIFFTKKRMLDVRTMRLRSTPSIKYCAHYWRVGLAFILVMTDKMFPDVIDNFSRPRFLFSDGTLSQKTVRDKNADERPTMIFQFLPEWRFSNLWLVAPQKDVQTKSRRSFLFLPHGGYMQT